MCLYLLSCTVRKLKEQEAAALIDGIGVGPESMKEHYENVPKQDDGRLKNWIQNFFEKFRN